MIRNVTYESAYIISSGRENILYHFPVLQYFTNKILSTKRNDTIEEIYFVNIYNTIKQAGPYLNERIERKKVI